MKFSNYPTQGFADSRVRPVDDDPNKLQATLENLAPETVSAPKIGVLTPGLVPFLPGLCRLLLDEDLILQDQPTAFYNMQILETEILEAIFGTTRSDSIRSSLAHVKQVAASVRDRLSNDSWHILGRLENELTLFSGLRHNQTSELQELLNEMILAMSAFAGLAQERMTR